MVHLHIPADLGVETLLGGANALCLLLLAGWDTEVCRGAAHVVDIALELRILRHALGLFENGGVAAGLDDAALVEGQGAEAAAAKAAPTRGQAELHLLDGGHAALLFVRRVIGILIRQIVGQIHLVLGQGLLRRVLDHIFPLGIGLDQALCHKGIGVAILRVEAFGICSLVLAHLVPGGQRDGVVDAVQILCPVDGAVDEGEIADIQPTFERIRNFDNRALAHAIDQKICLGIEQNGALHLVGPVVVVRQSAQTRLHTADDDGGLLIGLSDQIAIDDRGIVRALADGAAGGIGVKLSAVLEDGIVIDHGIHIAAHDQKPVFGLAQRFDGLRVLPIRLRDDANLIARVLKYPGNNGMAEGGMIHIGVADHIDKVALLPVVLAHLRLVHGEKIGHSSLLSGAG